MSENWRPNWKDLEAYEKKISQTTKTTQHEIIAWEFLRRNSKYREDFEKNKDLIKDNKFFYYINKFYKTTCGPPVCMKVDMRDWYGLAHYSENYDPSVNNPPNFNNVQRYPLFEVPCESDLVDLLEVSKDSGGTAHGKPEETLINTPSKVDGSREIRHISMLDELLSANQCSKSHTQAITQYLPNNKEPEKKTLYIDVMDIPEEEPDPSVFIVRMSTDYNPVKQFRELKNYFRQHKNKYSAPGHINNNYIRYLRILDALAVGVPNSGLYGLYIDPETKEIKDDTNESTINTDIRLAKKLRDGGYIRIVKSKINHPRPKNCSDLIYPK